ncbi:ATP-binding cassette sub-family G member 4 [Monomorium pharaonis]|uniref:ATP-binding cassette sub-family G member 4 n=1 Tax=Monomorium pharaonis TaxID=307658 RepID=UPI00063F9510|nr:ATP-binding cassette sub-family G member 4 [Monomorium pharaonis]
MEMKTKNDITRTLDDKCKIHLQESKKLLEYERSQNFQMYIEISNLCYSIRNNKETEKTILHNVIGHFEPRKITMIIGPSGAGKTTLLKIISNKKLYNIKGNITVNGVEWNKGIFHKEMCYVPQQFDLLPLLTTRETLYIAARLKLDVNQTKQAICLIVNDIAENLNLTNCLDTLVHKLSGGERKRLSIGVEIITKTSVLLLDEPTSGLDSTASYQLLNMLHNIASENCTVVCSIHQPSSQMISLVDNIMVLNQGRCMYCGPTNEILNTYSIAGFTCPNFYNITEFVLEVITGQRGGDLENLHKICYDKYKEFKSRSKHNENELNLPIDSKQKFETDNIPINNRIYQEKSIWQQQKILFLRALISIKRDNFLTKIRFVTHVIVGIIFGIVFYNFGNDAEKVPSNIACLFLMLLFLFFVSAMQIVLIIPMETVVFLQEHLNNYYSLTSYYSVKVLAELPMQILCGSSFMLITYYMTGQPMEYDRILQMWSICVLIVILGQTLGILAGTAFNAEMGLFLVPSMNIPLVLFAGFYVKINELPMYLQAVSMISYFRYAFEGIMQAIYLDRPNLSCLEIYCYLKSPKKILSLLNMSTVTFPVIIIILCSWILCLHIITYAVLRWKIYYSTK